jgi:oxygen-independent coproporphyrinogen III oxidase
LGSSERSISLYVHVPFCTDKCLYCDFYSVRCRTVSDVTQEAVVDQTISQSAFLLDNLDAREEVPTIFIGGGTPSVLPRPLLRRLLAAFEGLGPKEWSVEANPESIDREFLDICHSSGVTRLSVGVQSLRDERLRLLRRPCTRADILRAFDLVSRQWTGELNFDYIAGIPGQTVSEVREDLHVIQGMRPSHVSLYQLTTEPGTQMEKELARGALALNSPEQDEELWLQGCAELERAGFQHYEISNFCLPLKECRHNLRYWRLEPYLGVGPSAVSTIPSADAQRAFPGFSASDQKQGAPVRLTTPRSFPSFLQGKEKGWNMETEVISAADFLLETLMMGLRLAEGIGRPSFESRFGREFDELLPGLWKRWEAKGLAAPPGEVLRLTEGGRLILDALLREVAEGLSGSTIPPLDIRWP